MKGDWLHNNSNTYEKIKIKDNTNIFVGNSFFLIRFKQNAWSNIYKSVDGDFMYTDIICIIITT